MLKRIKSFIKLKMALGTLHELLPDATIEEIQAYDDECAICRVFTTISISLGFMSSCVNEVFDSSGHVLYIGRNPWQRLRSYRAIIFSILLV